MAAPRCPQCGTVAFLETQECANCGSTMGYHYPSLSMVVAVPDVVRWDIVRERGCGGLRVPVAPR